MDDGRSRMLLNEENMWRSDRLRREVVASTGGPTGTSWYRLPDDCFDGTCATCATLPPTAGRPLGDVDDPLDVRCREPDMVEVRAHQTACHVVIHYRPPEAALWDAQTHATAARVVPRLDLSSVVSEYCNHTTGYWTAKKPRGEIQNTQQRQGPRRCCTAIQLLRQRRLLRCEKLLLFPMYP